MFDTTTQLSAWKVTRYGGPEVLAPVNLPVPTPNARQVLIRVHASAVSRADGLMRAGQPKFARLFLGLSRPRAGLSGTCFSGEVIGIGDQVTRFQVGDAVFGEAGMQFGANASHICLDEGGVLMAKPGIVSHEEAAVMCDGVLTSWHFLTKVAVLKRGEKVLILGGAGSLGSAAVQFAADLGAEVTATSSARNLSLLSELGAAHVIDYARADAFVADAGYDVVFDTLGVARFSQARPALARGGRYVCPVLGGRLLREILMSRLWGTKRARFAAAGLQDPKLLRGHLDDILKVMYRGAFVPLMDRTYPLSDLVEAHRYVATGHKRGNVVVV